ARSGTSSSTAAWHLLLRALRGVLRSRSVRISGLVSGRKGDHLAQQCEGGGEHPLRPHIVTEGAGVETVRREELRVPGEGVAAPAGQIDQRRCGPRRRRRDVLVEQLAAALVERTLHHPRHLRRKRKLPPASD